MALEDTKVAGRDADRVTTDDRLVLTWLGVVHRLRDCDEVGGWVDRADGDGVIEADSDAVPDPEVDADGLALLDAEALCDSDIGRVVAWLRVRYWLRD